MGREGVSPLFNRDYDLVPAWGTGNNCLWVSTLPNSDFAGYIPGFFHRAPKAECENRRGETLIECREYSAICSATERRQTEANNSF
jgi:hypothetical protein